MVNAPQCVLKKLKNVKASVTIENALVLPLFLFFAITLMYLMEYVKINNAISQSLYKQSLKIASYGYTISKLEDNALIDNFEMTKEIVSNEFIIMTLKEELKSLKIKSNLVNLSGLSLSNSQILNHNGKIHIKISFEFSPPFHSFGLPNIKCKQEVFTHAWVGYENDFDTDDDVYVYITKSGTAYHSSSNCTYIHITPSAVSAFDIENKRNESGGKYKPCEKCAKNKIGGICYITPFGTSYHFDKNCGSISREVKRVKLSSVGGRKPCSKCY